MSNTSTQYNPIPANYKPTHPDVGRVDWRLDKGFASRYVATRAFSRGEVIHKIDTSVFTKVDKPRYTSVQIGKDEHIELNSDLVYMNHSCDPSVFFNTTTWELIAARDIAVGDELTFFYPSTEWRMDQPFQCWCNAKHCLREIRGADYASPEALKGHFINEHILALLAEKNQSNQQQ
jgi:hypothetical protein